MSARADLLADGGSAASSGEFFRSPEFLSAEGSTHTLRIGTPEAPLAAPLLLREIPGSGRADAISPYGYPGIDSPEPIDPPLDPSEVDWSATGLISLFIRHRIGAAVPLAGATARNVVQIADPALERKSRPSDRRQIRRNEEAGYTVEIVAGPDAGAEQRAGFFSAYTQTMVRTEAADRYFFDAGYFDTLLASPLARLFLVSGPEGDLAAGSLVVESDGMLHYYLSGTADPHLRSSPMKTLLARLVDLSEEEGMPVNFGGGLSPGDALEEFKRGFANREKTWHTSEVICDPEAYEELSANRSAPAGFFPAYRAPA